MHGRAQPSLVVVLKGRVFDLTDFTLEHPGSPEILRSVAGCDGTARFEAVHAHTFYAKSQMPLYEVRETTTMTTSALPPFFFGSIDDDRYGSGSGSGGASAAREAVPLSARSAWLAAPRCVDIRDRRKASRQRRRTAASFAEKDEGGDHQLSDAEATFDAAPCPHCGCNCREHAIFADWIGHSHADEDDDDADLVRRLEAVPRWEIAHRMERKRSRAEARRRRAQWRSSHDDHNHHRRRRHLQQQEQQQQQQQRWWWWQRDGSEEKAEVMAAPAAATAAAVAEASALIYAPVAPPGTIATRLPGENAE